jgi:hypothetical protein
MEVRAGKKMATKKNGQRSAAKKIDCGRMLVEGKEADEKETNHPAHPMDCNEKVCSVHIQSIHFLSSSCVLL